MIIIAVAAILLGFSLVEYFSVSSVKISRNAKEIKYEEEDGEIYANEMPSDSVVKVHRAEISRSGDFINYQYWVVFKGWKPYKSLKVYEDGDIIKVIYVEADTNETTNVSIGWKMTNQTKRKKVLIYRNNLLVRRNIVREDPIY